MKAAESYSSGLCFSSHIMANSYMLPDMANMLRAVVGGVGTVSTPTGQEILDQRLNMFDVYMRDANQLARGITAMVVAEESSMAGKYLFPLLVKPGGPSAATLAGKVHELTKQMTKVEETAKSGVNRAADALTAAKAGKGAAAELAKATAAIAALQKELKTLKNTEQSTAATARKMKARVDALEAAKP